MDISPLIEAARQALAAEADPALVGPALTSLRKALLYYAMSPAQRSEEQKLRTDLELKRRAVATTKDIPKNR